MVDVTRADTKGEATRARVLAAAAAVFRERGYAGVRLADIAERADMQAGSLYYHFASREELVAEVLQVGHARMVDTLQGHLDTLPPATSPQDRLREAMVAHVVAVLGDGDYTSAALRIVGQVPDEIRNPVLHGQMAYGALWHRLLHETQAAGALRSDADLPVVRMLLMGGLNSTTDWYRQPSAQSPERLATALAAMCLDGIATRRSRTRRPHPLIDSGAHGDLTETRVPRREVTRQRILEAASSTFAEHGYAATRLADIAARADMQTGSLYYHFASREDLVTELLTIASRRSHEALVRQVEGVPKRASDVTRLEAAIAAHLGTIWAPGSNAPALVRIFANVPEEVRDAVKAERAAYSATWSGLVQAAVDSGQISMELSVRDFLRVLNGAMNWTVEWYRPDGRMPPHALAAELAHLVLDGLVPLDTSSKSK